MGIFDNFVREEAPRLEPGDYRVEVTDVEETTSKTSGRTGPISVLSIISSKTNISTGI